MFENLIKSGEIRWNRKRLMDPIFILLNVGGEGVVEAKNLWLLESKYGFFAVSGTTTLLLKYGNTGID